MKKLLFSILILLLTGLSFAEKINFSVTYYEPQSNIVKTKTFANDSEQIGTSILNMNGCKVILIEGLEKFNNLICLSVNAMDFSLIDRHIFPGAKKVKTLLMGSSIVTRLDFIKDLPELEGIRLTSYGFRPEKNSSIDLSIGKNLVCFIIGKDLGRKSVFKDIKEVGDKLELLSIGNCDFNTDCLFSLQRRHPNLKFNLDPELEEKLSKKGLRIITGDEYSSIMERLEMDGR